MGKKKTTKAVKPRSAKRGGGKARDSKLEGASALEAVRSGLSVETERPVGAMSDVEIGHVAGDVWGVLSRQGALTVSAIKKEVHAPGDLVVAAIGWLAREDKLAFSNAGRSVKVSLH